MHLNRKGITSENFCCVCFSKIKIPYILTKPCNFPCPFSNLKFSFLRPCNFLETYRGNRWAQNQYPLDTGENVPQLPHSLRECLSVVMTFYFRNDMKTYILQRVFFTSNGYNSKNINFYAKLLDAFFHFTADA